MKMLYSMRNSETHELNNFATKEIFHSKKDSQPLNSQ